MPVQETLLAAFQPTSTDKPIDLLLPPPCHCRHPSSRRVAPTAEKALPNGDIYTGTLSGNVPHGKGKYLWSDGCMYEGEWKRGRAHGLGKFSWPSGATYEGQFKDGGMSGHGTFIGVEGDSYKGQWLSDRKHGYGEKRYANGDVYRGSWRFNLQDGEGKYRWSNGNEYEGEWKLGVLHGKGVLVWANGNRFEGEWDNGVSKGKGVFTFGKKRYEEEEEGRVVNRKRLSVDSNLPRICIWELDGEAGDITCDIVDNVEASSIIMAKDNVERSPCTVSVDADFKKLPGQTISKGHKNYDLMLKLQLGIRYLFFFCSRSY